MGAHDDYGEPRSYQSDSTGSPLWAAALGALSFVLTWGTGIGLTILVVRAISPKVAHPKEANEGFGDFVDGLLIFWLGVGVSFAIALVVGVVVSGHVTTRQLLRRGDRTPD